MICWERWIWTNHTTFFHVLYLYMFAGTRAAANLSSSSRESSFNFPSVSFSPVSRHGGPDLRTSGVQMEGYNPGRCLETLGSTRRLRGR